MKCRPPVLVLLGFPAAPPGPALRAPLLRGDFCAWTRPRAPPLPGLLASFVFLSSSSSSPGASEAPAPSPGTAPPSSSTRAQVLPRSLTGLNSASAGGFPGPRILHRPARPSALSTQGPPLLSPRISHLRLAAHETEFPTFFLFSSLSASREMAGPSFEDPRFIHLSSASVTAITFARPAGGSRCLCLRKTPASEWSSARSRARPPFSLTPITAPR